MMLGIDSRLIAIAGAFTGAHIASPGVIMNLLATAQAQILKRKLSQKLTLRKF